MHLSLQQNPSRSWGAATDARRAHTSPDAPTHLSSKNMKKMCTLPKLEQDHYYSPPLERMKMKMIALKKFTRRMTITTGAKMDKIWVKHSILDKHNSNKINSQFFKCVCFIWISIHFHGNFLYPTTSGSLAWFPFNFCPQPRLNLCIPGLSSISCIFFYLIYLGLAIFFSTRGCVGYACT